MQILQHGDTGGMACGLSSAGPKSQIRRFFIGKSTSPRKRITLLQEITSLVNIISFGQSEAKCAAGIRIKLEQQGIPIRLLWLGKKRRE